MRYGFRKKSIARFPPCWRRRQRSPTPSSTRRDDGRSSGSTSSAAGIFLYRECGFFVGSLRNARTRGVYRPPAAGHFPRGFPEEDRSANPVAEPRNVIAGRLVAGAAGAKRGVGTARARARPGAVLSARDSWSRGLELSLLPRDSTDQRGHG